MDIPRNATPGPSSLPMQPSGSGLHTAQPDPQIGPTGPVQRIAQSDSAQSSLAQSDNCSVSVNMNSNTASSSVVSLPPDTGRYHILPPSHVQSFTNHPLPPSPPRFAAYMCRDPLLPSPSPPPRLSAPIRRDTTHTFANIYWTTVLLPHSNPNRFQQVLSNLSVYHLLHLSVHRLLLNLSVYHLLHLPVYRLLTMRHLLCLPIHRLFPNLFRLSRNMRLLLSMRHLDTNMHFRRTLILRIYRFCLFHLLPLLLQLVVLYLPLPIFPF